MQKYYKFILFLKGVFSIFEILTGIFALIFGYEKIQILISGFLQFELKEDPSDFIAGKILNMIQEVSPHSGILIALYLIIEGITKIILIYGVYKDKKIVFPFAFFVFGGIFLYEIILMFQGNIMYTLPLFILDGLLIWVIYKEYIRILSKKY